jgi:Xaa-Pro dipeptidase
LIICARDKGLVMAATRLIHFGKLPDEVRRKAALTAQVEVAVMAATRPGKTFDQVFGDIQRAYAAVGYDGEWQLHHQGGSIAYEPREFLAVPGCTEVVKSGMAFAWNPSITGTKNEDTILVNDTGYEVISNTPGWPVLNVNQGDQVIARPAILEIL